MKAERILSGVAIVGFLVGLVGLGGRITGGHTVAAYNTYVPWGLWVALFTTLIGVSVGAFLIASLAFGFRVRALAPLGRIALLTAFAALAGGLVAIWLDLGHPWRFIQLFVSTGTSSVMGWMAWAYTLYGILLLALIFLVKQDTKMAAVRGLCLVGLPLILIFGGAEGSLFGVVGAQALWESGLTPIIFLAEGALSGIAVVAFLGVIFAKIRPDAQTLLRWMLIGLLLAVVVFEWAEYSTGLYAGIPAKADSLRLILFGPFWWVFWFVHFALGIVVPLLLLGFVGHRAEGLATAGALIALTGIAGKLNLVIPALVVPEFEALKTAFTGLGLTFDYFPTLHEWLLAVWIVSLAALVFLGGYRFVFGEEAKQPA